MLEQPVFAPVTQAADWDSNPIDQAALPFAGAATTELHLTSSKHTNPRPSFMQQCGPFERRGAAADDDDVLVSELIVGLEAPRVVDSIRWKLLDLSRKLREPGEPDGDNHALRVHDLA